MIPTERIRQELRDLLPEAALPPRSVAVLLPCFSGEAEVGAVIESFGAALLARVAGRS